MVKRDVYVRPVGNKIVKITAEIFSFRPTDCWPTTVEGRLLGLPSEDLALLGRGGEAASLAIYSRNTPWRYHLQPVDLDGRFAGRAFPKFP